MSEHKNTHFDRPGGYAMPSGARSIQADTDQHERVHLIGDDVDAYQPQ